MSEHGFRTGDDMGWNIGSYVTPQQPWKRSATVLQVGDGGPSIPVWPEPLRPRTDGVEAV